MSQPIKLISLNIWGGRIYAPFIDFLKSRFGDTDIFCFQEVFDNPSEKHSRIHKEVREDINQGIKPILSDFNGWLAPSQDYEESLAMYVIKTIPLQKTGDVFVYRWKNAMVGNDGTTFGVNVQYAQFEQNKKQYTICNLHGHWTPKFKGDDPARIEQSKNIKKFLDSIEGAKILCGDFNLAPDTQSMEILEDNMRNLIKEYGITSTRSHHYKEGVKFADYILVSPEIEVKDFKVIQDVVSDHLPLYLEFQ